MKLQRSVLPLSFFLLLTLLIAFLYMRVPRGLGGVAKQHYRIAVKAFNAGNNDEAITYASYVIERQPD